MPATKVTEFLRPDEPLPPRTLKTYTEDQLMALEPPTYILDRFVPEKTLGFVAGVPNSGKSLLVLDWALTLARGWDWYGHKSVPQSVVYLTSEGTSGIAARVEAWHLNRGVKDAVKERFIVATEPLKLGGDPSKEYPDQAAVEALLTEREATMLVIDPMINYFVGSGKDEQNASHFTGWCQKLVAEREMTVIINHHVAKVGTGQGGGLILRDSGAFAGAADWVYEMDAKFYPNKDDEDAEQGVQYIMLRSHKVKDGGVPQKMRFELKQIVASKATARLDGTPGTSVVLSLTSNKVTDGVGATRDVALEETVYETLVTRGPLSGTRVEECVTGRATEIRVALNRLASEGRIKKEGSGPQTRWEAVAAEQPETLEET